MAKADPFIQQEIAPKLAPGEQIVSTGFLFNKSLALAALVGALALAGSGYFFAALTQTRLFIIKTRMGLFGIKLANDGVVEIPYDTIQSVETGGFLNQKTVKLTLKDGNVLKYKLNTFAKYASGQKQFLATLQQLQSGRAAS